MNDRKCVRCGSETELGWIKTLAGHGIQWATQSRVRFLRRFPQSKILPLQAYRCLKCGTVEYVAVSTPDYDRL